MLEERVYKIASNNDSVYTLTNHDDIVCITRFDFEGFQVWNRTWGEDMNNILSVGLGADDDFVYFIVGNPSTDVSFLVKMDTSGNVIWNATIEDVELFDISAFGGEVYVVGCSREGWETTGLNTFIGKYDADGNLLWNTTWMYANGSYIHDYGYGIAANGSDVYLVGLIREQFEYDQAFLAKYSEDGQHIWNRTWGEYPNLASEVVVNGSSVYVLGIHDQFFMETVIKKFDGEGTEQWSRRWESLYTSDDVGQGICVKGNEIIVIGFTRLWAGINSYYGHYLFLLRLDDQGEVLGSLLWEDNYDVSGHDVTMKNSSIYVIGYTDTRNAYLSNYPFLAHYPIESIILPYYNISHVGSGYSNPNEGFYQHSVGYDVSVNAYHKQGWILDHWEVNGKRVEGMGPYEFTLEYDTNITIVFVEAQQPDWNVSWDSNVMESGYGIAASSEYLFFTGKTTTDDEGLNAFLAKFDLEGNQIWNTSLGGSENDVGSDVAMSDDAVYMVGYTYSRNVSSMDLIVAKYDFTGDLLWNVTWGGPDLDVGYRIAQAGNIVCIAGYSYYLEYYTYMGQTYYNTIYNYTFLVSFDTEGNQLWNTSWSGAELVYVGDISINGSNIYYVSSQFLYGGDEYSVYLAKFDLDGNQIWNSTFNTRESEKGTGLALVGDDIYVCGTKEQGYSDDILLRILINLCFLRFNPPRLDL